MDFVSFKISAVHFEVESMYNVGNTQYKNISRNDYTSKTFSQKYLYPLCFETEENAAPLFALTGLCGAMDSALDF